MYHSPVLTKQKDQFLPLAVCLGEGLQMTNIIKDIWEDAERGVSWLPLGLKNDPDNSAEMQNYYSSMPKDKKIELLNDQIKIACGHLRNGVRFTTMIPLREQGIRRFCSWCIAMAFLSLKKVYDNPLFTDSSQSKISREQVKSVVRWSSICAYSNFTLNRYFDHISKGLPFVDIDQCELYARVSKWSNF
jgi:farnesyl-diphosphate farnesyltransferase